ncbi:MAG: choice-of-anchor U domain-containing protein [Pseudomonadota bacterium]
MESGVSNPGDGSGFGDGNDDGTQDGNQSNVVSLKTDDQENYLTFAVSNETGIEFADVSVMSSSEAGAPSDLYFPFGVFGFIMADVTEGETVTIRIYMPRDEAITGNYKKSSASGLWENIATGVDNETYPNKTVITIQIAEGGGFDSDDDPSTITDPGAPGYFRNSTIPTVNEWVILILGLLLVLFSLKRYSRSID